MPFLNEERRDEFDSTVDLGRDDNSRPGTAAQPKPETADRGTVRLGDSCITAEFPPLRPSKTETADRGTVRPGDASITAEFAPRR